MARTAADSCRHCRMRRTDLESGARAGGPGAERMNWVAHASCLRVGVLVSLFPEFYPPNGSIVKVRYKPPTRKTDMWGTLVS